ncbi:NUDIX hydrolase [Amnibacterium endophyticum]|uniref:NUDIX domain-containing protein n=1 Tax=Amnibacterium endophyticum TaxID=2109337 RepID=A0ABW4LFB8_9MICO
MTAVIRVVAALITDEAGRLLLVRKRGTDRFMQAGGKPEAGETAREALVRELMEELGLAVDPDAHRGLGAFRTEAANEPDHVLEAEVFALRVPGGDLPPRAELAETRWATPEEADALGDRLAPLARLLLAEPDAQVRSVPSTP